MKHYSCGGEVLYNKDESIWYCGRCGKTFLTISDLNTDNEVCDENE